MSKYLNIARSAFVSGSCAVLFIASLYGVRYLDRLADRSSNFASWQLRGPVEIE
jgi:hypothetical protein